MYAYLPSALIAFLFKQLFKITEVKRIDKYSSRDVMQCGELLWVLTRFLFCPFFDWDSNVLVVNLCSRECKSTFFSYSAAWKVEQLVARHLCRMFQSNLILWVHNFNTTAAEVQWTANSLLTFYITCQVLKLEFCIFHQVVRVISRNRPLKESTTMYCTCRQIFCRKF